MPHDRRSRRILLAMLGLVGVALSVAVGCARSSNLRSTAGPLPDLVPAGELHPDAGAVARGVNSPAAVAGAGSSDRDVIAPRSHPARDRGPNPGGSAAGASPGAPASIAPISRSTSNGATPAMGPPVPDGTEEANQSAPGAEPSPSAVPGGGAPAPAVSPTPLLDAEIRRAQSVTRQHFESLNAVETPTPLPDPVDPPAARPAPAAVVETKPADPDPEPVPPLPPLAASARLAVDPGTSESARKLTLPTLIPIDPSAPGSSVPVPAPAPAPIPPPPSVTADGQGPSPAQLEADAAAHEGRRPTLAPVEEETGGPDGRAAMAAADPPPADERPSPSAQPVAEPDRAQRPHLEIAELKLCTQVKDFGDVEAIDHRTVKAGRPMRVYCEMDGLEYQPRGEVFVSRLAAHIELRSGSDGPVVWEQAPGTAEYVCKRRRHDYYVSYRIELPRSLEPGPYRLRLIQTDLVGNRVASREIPVTIVRSAPRRE
jgi:hypothetical protein